MGSWKLTGLDSCLAAPLLGLRAATLAGLLVGEAVADFALGAGQRVVTATGALRDLPRGDRARAMARAEARAFRTGSAGELRCELVPL